MKNKKKTINFAVLAVITLFFFVAFAGLFAVVLVAGNDSAKNLLGPDFSGIISNMGAAYNVGKVGNGNYIPFVAIGVSAFAFIMFLLAIIVCIVRKRPVIVLGAIVGLLFVVPFAILLEKTGRVFPELIFVNPIENILTIALYTVAIIYVVLAFITWIASLSIKAVGKEEQEVTEEVAAEEIPVEKAEEQLPEIEPEPEQLYGGEELREMIRQVIREELANFKAQGNAPTFSGPLVVQYFNGSQEVPVTETVQEEVPAPTPEPEPVVQEEVAVEPVVEQVEPLPTTEETNKTPIIRIPFTTRIVEAEQEMKDNYNELKNEILSWGVKSRVSSSGDTFRLHRKTYVKLTIAGKSLKLYFALDPKEYQDSTIPVQDASDKNIYQEIPLIFKVKSGLSMRRAKQLIQDVMEKDGLEQGEIAKTDWTKEIEANLNEADEAEKVEEEAEE